jgi:hypothetical protein
LFTTGQKNKNSSLIPLFLAVLQDPCSLNPDSDPDSQDFDDQIFKKIQFNNIFDKKIAALKT